MALSPAEKQRRYRERQTVKREKVKRAPEGDLGDLQLSMPFFEYATFGVFGEILDLAGIEAPPFRDDSGGKSLHGTAEDVLERDGLTLGRNSLERAEVMVGTLIDAASALATEINDFKRHEITRRLETLSQDKAKFTGPDAPVINEILRLRRMLDTLSRDVRWTFPQWKAGAGKP